MFKKNKISALSLTELLVATVLIGIIMLGIVSFSFTIKQVQDSTRKSVILSSKLATAMGYLRKDAYNAIGYFSGLNTPNDDWTSGVMYPLASSNSICFSRDRYKTPNNYDDDAWRCYHAHVSSVSPKDYILWRCPEQARVPNPTSAQGQCADGIPNMLTPLHGAEALAYIHGPESLPFYTIHRQANGKLQYIDFKLKSRASNRDTAHPITNPEYELNTRVNPPQSAR